MEIFIDIELSRCYENVKYGSIQKYMINYSIKKAMGDVNGLVVTDFGCGPGTITAEVIKAGAKVVNAIDISEMQLDMCKRNVSKVALSSGCKVNYYLADLRDAELQTGVKAEIGLNIYVFPFSKNKPTLRKMCQSMYSNIKKGGTLVTLTTTINTSSIKKMTKLQQLNFAAEITSPRIGDTFEEIRFHLRSVEEGTGEETAIDLINTNLRLEEIEEGLTAVGFKNIERIRVSVDPEYNGYLKKEFSELIDAADMFIITATA